MGTSKLLILAKNTDATSAARGYTYQALKTVELWLYNYIHNIDDKIYCEYEDDIFESNSLLSSVKFTQIKLYSSTFSFCDTEIKKALFNFFMLDIKNEYENQHKIFIFYTNTSIANTRLNNDAELFKDWVTYQGALPDQLLTNCAAKVKAVIQDYVNNNKVAKDKSYVQEFNLLDENYWKQFINKIQWDFLNKSPEEEMEDINTRIEALIEKLNYPAVKNSPEGLIGHLFKTVSLKTANKDIQEKMLTATALEKYLLGFGDESNTWYSTVLFAWKDRACSEISTMGQLLEVIDAARYCRRRKYLWKHLTQWRSILELIIDNKLFSDYYLKSATYEFIQLHVLYDRETNSIDTNSLIGKERYIYDYFSKLDWVCDPKQFDEVTVVLIWLASILRSGMIDIDPSYLIRTIINVYRKLVNKIRVEKNVNRLCGFLEIKSCLCLNLSVLQIMNVSTNKCFAPLQLLLEQIELALLYDVSKLSFRLNKYIRLFMQVDHQKFEIFINEFETILEKVDSIVNTRHGHHEVAGIKLSRAISFLTESNHSLAKLKALECFHQAKEMYFQAGANSNHILCLIDIGNIYNDLNLHYAAKYYLISAFFASENLELPTHIKHKRMVDSLEKLYSVEFYSGSWLSAMAVFYLIDLIIQNLEGDELILSANQMAYLHDSYIFMIHCCTLFCPDMMYLTQSRSLKLGWEHQEFSKITGNLQSEFSTISAIINKLNGKLTNFPLSDLDEFRFIRFLVLGSEWTIHFKNTYLNNLVGEEFCAILQIFLAELALSGVDLYLINLPIDLEINIGNSIASPQQIPDNDVSKWSLTLSTYTADIKPQEYYPLILSLVIDILKEISLARDEEFMNKVNSIQEKTEFLKKGLATNNYQLLLSKLLTKDVFDSFFRNQFIIPDRLNRNVELSLESAMLKPPMELCDKYIETDIKDSIKNRYTNCSTCLSVILPVLKKIDNFSEMIKELRGDGWVDWQITNALLNVFINYKADQMLPPLTTNDPAQIHKRSELMHSLIFVKGNESDKDTPLSIFSKNSVISHLEFGLVSFLRTNGLDCKMNTPNFRAINNFITTRMGVTSDNVYNDLNLLYDIT